MALLELMRLMGADVLRLYRLQFLGRSHGSLSSIVEERDFRAPNSAAAIEEMRGLEWPSRALSAWVVDADGVVLGERRRFD